MMNRFSRLFAFLLLFLCATSAHAQTADTPQNGSTFVVNQTDDSDDGVCGTGDCTLREAINAANNAAGGDTILFASGGTGTITLAQGELPVTDSLTILGPGARALAISGGDTSRIFNASGGTVRLSGLTLRNGRITGSQVQGGAIFNSTTLLLVECTVRDNAAIGSDFAIGGAIYSQGTTTLVRCTLSNNKAQGDLNGAFGGAVKHDGAGVLTVQNSTLSGNQAVGFNNAFGGAVQGYGRIVIESSTLTANGVNSRSSVGGSGVSFNGFNVVYGSITNSIVAGNTGADQVDNSFNNGGSNFLSGDPQLNALADNGGPTDTHLPQVTSPVVDAGSTTLSVDQRGRVRPFDGDGVNGAQDDIGAVERGSTTALQSGPFLVVNSTADGDDGACTPDADGCTLREAINAANTDGMNSDITFDTTIFAGKQTILLDAALPNILSTISISGPTTGVILDAQQNRGIFRVFLGPTLGDLSLSNLSLLNSTDSGIRNNGGILRLLNCTLAGNSADFNGGAINNENSSTATLSNCTVSGNSSGRAGSASGGGLFNGSGTLSLFNCTVSGNSAINRSRGGGISNRGTLNVSNCTISGNSAGDDDGGGGIFNDFQGTLNLNNSIVAGNISTEGGGPDIFGAVASGDYNLVQDPSDATLSGTNNITGQDPRLGALQDNGGPTQTIALLAGSPAIDKGNSTLPTDQRGLPRPVDFPGIPNAQDGNGSDIGAYEEQTPPNSAPVAKDDNVSVNEDSGATPLHLLDNDTDADGNALRIAFVVQSPINGRLTPISAANGTDTIDLAYTPNANFNGIVSFTYSITDGTDSSRQATVNITVNAVNDAPSFTKGADQTVNEDSGAQTVAGFTTAISAGPPNESAQTLTFTTTNNNNALFSSQPAISSNGVLTFTPAANASGVAIVSVFLRDNGGTANGGVDTSATQTFTITVNAVNDPPTARDDNASTVALTPVKIAVLANDRDVEGDTLSIQSVTQPANGTVVINPDGTLTYTGNGTLSQDSFTYTISDGQGGTSTATVTVTRTQPSSTATAKVTGSGTIRVSGGTANFSLNPQVKKDGSISGGVSYSDPTQNLTVQSTNISGIVFDALGKVASIYGTATVNGMSNINFFVEVADVGEPGKARDTFRIVAGSYSAQGVLSSGNIQVHKTK